MKGAKRNIAAHVYCWLCVVKHEGALSKGKQGTFI